MNDPNNYLVSCNAQRLIFSENYLNYIDKKFASSYDFKDQSWLFHAVQTTIFLFTTLMRLHTTDLGVQHL